MGRLPTRTLLNNTLGFALAFAAWVALGPAARSVGAELGLSPGATEWLRATPMLTGSVLRIPIGVLADRLGARRTFSALLLAGAGGALVLASAQGTVAAFSGALILGLVGTTFVVGVQAVSAQTPGPLRGTALGLFGAGNLGTALTTMGLPWVLEAWGWRPAMVGYAAVLGLSAVGYWAAAGDSDVDKPRVTSSAGSALKPLAHPDAWRLSLAYAASFGGFLCLSLTLTDWYADLGRELKAAGTLATVFTFTASLARIPGGWVADRWPTRPWLRISLAVAGLLVLPTLLRWPLGIAVPALFAAALSMGVAMTATFRAIPERFPTQVGAVGGLVGALGGLGGFFLPPLGAALETATSRQGVRFLPLVLLGLVAAALAPRTRRAAADDVNEPSLRRAA